MMPPLFFPLILTGIFMKQASARSAATSRSVALSVLEHAVREQQTAPVQALLDNALGQCALSRQDAALATELVYGYLRWELRLSWLLGLFLQKPEKLPPTMLLMLGLAAYELLHLDKVPARATVHTCVETVRRRFGQGLSRVTNGVLRGLAGLETAPHDLDLYATQIHDPVRLISVFHAVPEWIVRLWLDAFGEERTQVLAEAAHATPWTGIRINAHRADALQLKNQLGQDAATSHAAGHWGLCFDPRSKPSGLHRLHQSGHLSFQGVSSQQALAALWPTQAQDRVWDACAGRGGKTFALMEQGVNVTLASDTSAARLAGMAHDAFRLGLAVPQRYLGSAEHPAFTSFMDTILLDVPCSGLGTLARRPDLRRLQRPEHLPPLYALQQRLLQAAWERLAVGGRLVYITCTVNPLENQRPIDNHLAAHADAELENQWSNAFDATPETGADRMFGVTLRKR